MSKGKPKTTIKNSYLAPKAPKALPDMRAVTIDGMPKFSFRFADFEDRVDWSWPSDSTTIEILKFISEVSKNEWREILMQNSGGHKKHHHHEFASVCKEARDLIALMKHDERFEELFRFRLTGKKRLWGFKQGEVFYPLWWDAEHKIYPTELE